MNTWIVSIPTRPTHGNAGRQIFVIDASSAQEARLQALSQAQTDTARRSRRHAHLDLQDPATVEHYDWAYGTL